MQYVQNLLFYFIGDSLAHDSDVCRLGWDEIGFFAQTFDPPSGVVRCPLKNRSGILNDIKKAPFHKIEKLF